MKLLDGRELSGFIKERQAKQVRALRQAHSIFPKLAIVRTIDDPVIDTYVGLKKRYGDDILIDVDVHHVSSDDLLVTIDKLNHDKSVHGIVVQLPLADPSQTDVAVRAVTPAKDIDGLGSTEVYDPATPTAINWLLAGYGVELGQKKVAIVGVGRLVGRPLAEMWRASGIETTTFDKGDDLMRLKEYDVIVTATGVPGLITSDMIQIGAVVVDAGTASEGGVIKGDVDEAVRARDDLMITPEKGGVGPLTVAALFDNVIRSAQALIKA